MLSYITLCADDYGLAPGVSRAILELIAQGRLQATSCMTGSPHWPEAAKHLKPLEEQADIGLHLTLTDQTPLGSMPNLAPEGRFPSLGQLLRLALLRRLDQAEISAEFDRQVDAFVVHFGRLPDFLDGHHHIHQLPVVRAAVLELWQRRFGANTWVRSCVESWPTLLARNVSPVRALVISSLGLVFRRQLQARGIPHNASFRGVYDFSGRVPFATLFQRFLSPAKEGALMMVHPGWVDAELERVDGLTTQREVEARFLASDAFVLLLAEHGTSLRRLGKP